MHPEVHFGVRRLVQNQHAPPRWPMAALPVSELGVLGQVIDVLSAARSDARMRTKVQSTVLLYKQLCFPLRTIPSPFPKPHHIPAPLPSVPHLVPRKCTPSASKSCGLVTRTQELKPEAAGKRHLWPVSPGCELMCESVLETRETRRRQGTR